MDKLLLAATAAATPEVVAASIHTGGKHLCSAWGFVQSRPLHANVLLLLLLLPSQVVAAFIRPHPGKRVRSAWNFVHHNMGRLVVLVAWAAIWLGVTLWHKMGGPRGGYPRWIAPLAGK